MSEPAHRAGRPHQVRVACDRERLPRACYRDDVSVPAATSYPRIARDPAIARGQPIVAGTRISVAVLVRAHQLGLGFDELLVQYPSLDAADVHAAMLYYLDHREEIDALLAEAESPPEGAEVVKG